jgi:aryl-alcohol dehydrogenase-like predicted oxidoreductase
MNKRVLGRTGIEVSELALGGLFVSSHGGTYDQAQPAIARALELGVNYIDTAPGYGDSEEVLGRALESLGANNSVVLSTKLGGRPQPFLPQDKDALFASIEESLRLLKRDVIDVLFIHEPERPGQYDWWSNHEEVEGPVLEVIDELKKSGVVKYSGLGGTTVYEMARLVRTGKFDVVLTAFNYSLLWREAEEVLRAAKEHDMGIVVGSPLQQGSLAQRYDEEINNGASWISPARRAQYQALYDFLDEINLPLAEVAIRFVISNPDISTVLMGARSASEVENNVASVEKGALSEDVLRRLDEIAAMVPFRPYEEPMNLPFGRKYYGPATAR